jgi:hypothetical protein
VFALWFNARTRQHSPLETMSVSPSAAFPSVALDGDGDAHVLWEEDLGSGLEIRTRRRSWATGQWTAAETLSAGRASFVGEDYDGDLHAVFWSCNGTECRISARRFDRQTDSWSGGRDLGVGRLTRLYTPLIVATGRNHHAFIAWESSTGVGFVSWRFDPAKGDWFPVATNGTPRFATEQVRLVVSSTGAAALAWPEWMSATELLVSVFDPQTDSFMPPVAMRTLEPKVGFTHVLEVDDAGNVWIAWLAGDGQTDGPFPLWMSSWVCRP